MASQPVRLKSKAQGLGFIGGLLQRRAGSERVRRARSERVRRAESEKRVNQPASQSVSQKTKALGLGLLGGLLQWEERVRKEAASQAVKHLAGLQDVLSAP